jgi:hypothetical protein
LVWWADETRLKQAIESQLGGLATLAQSVRVRVALYGMPVWEDVVHVFNLAGHRNATRAYAWSSPIEGSTRRRFFTVLHMGGVRSPLDAVRAAIAAEHRVKQQGIHSSRSN